MSSETLTPEAQDEEAAAEAPAPDVSVDGGSVDSADVVPASRFNGLMSKLNSVQAEKNAEIAALQAEVERLSQAEWEQDSMSDETLVEVRALREELAKRDLKEARKAAIAAHPGAAVLADLIVGDSPEAIENMAAEIEKRLLSATGAAQETEDSSSGDSEDQETAPAPTPEAPVIAGSTVIDESLTTDEVISGAIEAGNWSALWDGLNARAKVRAQQGSADMTVG